MRVTSELALGFGLVFALAFWLGGTWVIEAFIADEGAREAALAYLPFCAAVPLIGVAAFQLDGLFIGTTQGRALRNAGMLAMAGYVALDMALAPRFGNTGVWSAFLMMYVLRALTLSAFLPGLMRQVRGQALTGSPRSAPGP